MARSEEEQKAFEAARTVYAYCLAVENHDSQTLKELHAVDRSKEEWRELAEQAINALVGSARAEVKGCGVTPAYFFKSAIQALLSLEALGAPPGKLASD